MRRYAVILFILCAGGVGIFWMLTIPQTIPVEALNGLEGDPSRGEGIFHAAGCASCHADPNAKGEAKYRLSGGRALKTPFGTFVVPNISPHGEDGIGNWSTLQFVNSVMRGVSPRGQHYYPAFPYMSYQRMTLGDAVDLKAFMDTLPAVAGKQRDHNLPLLFQVRRGLGLWKALFMDYTGFQPRADRNAQINRGDYLVNALAHCGECHSPRNLLGAPERGWAFSGGPEPDGKDYVPNITPHSDGLGSWSEADLLSALATGFLPDFETFGGSMILVQENLALLSDGDRRAIVAYLNSLPALPSRWKDRARASGQ